MARKDPMTDERCQKCGIRKGAGHKCLVLVKTHRAPKKEEKKSLLEKILGLFSKKPAK